MITRASKLYQFFAMRARYGAAAIALIFVTILHSLLAEQLTLTGLVETATGTDFFDAEANDLITMFEWGIIVLFLILWAKGSQKAMLRIIVAYCGYVTLTLAASVIGLVLTLTIRKTVDSAFDLLWDAFMVWTVNVLIFAVWYWLLDGRDETRKHFLFPQQSNLLPGWENWKPGPLDFLFLAFSHSTAFSPTDTAALSHRAKLLIMVQATLSLITLAMIAARAVNILG